MKLSDFEEVKKQKDLLETATSLLESLQIDKSYDICIIIGNQVSTSIVDDVFQTILRECLTKYVEIVKERLTHLGVEL